MGNADDASQDESGRGARVSRLPRVLYAGTYERDYPRNRLVIAALRRAGCEVRELHQPVWERTRDKPAGYRGVVALVRLGARLSVAYLRLLLAFLPALRHTDIVVIGYIGQADMLTLGLIARLAGRPVIFNPLVTLTDTLVEDRRLVRPDSLAGKVVRVIDGLSLRVPRVVLVDTSESGAYIQRRFGVRRERVVRVPVGAEEALFRPDDRGRDRCRPASAPLEVLFYGKMIPLHGVETVIGAARLLAGEDVRFTLIGDGQLGPEIRRRAEALGLRNVRFERWVRYDQLPARVMQSDVVLGIFGDTDKAARVVPNKVYQAMAMGAAIVTRDSPAARRLLQDGGSALLVPPADPEALAAALRRLQDPTLRAALGQGAREAFERQASIEALARAITPAIAGALGCHPAPCRDIEA